MSLLATLYRPDFMQLLCQSKFLFIIIELTYFMRTVAIFTMEMQKKQSRHKIFKRKIMGSKNKNLQKLKTHIVDELHLSTTHGLPYLVKPNLHWCEKLFWALMFLLCIGLQYVLLSPLYDRYYNSPTVTSVEMDYFNWNVSFPAITLCAQYKNDDEAFGNVARLYANLSKEDVGSQLWSITNVDLNTVDKLVLENSDIIPPEEYASAAADAMRRFDDTNIVTNNDWPVTVDTVMTELGMCHVLNSNVAVFDNPSNWNKRNLTYKRRSIDLSVHDSEFYTHIVRYADTYKVFIHSPDEVIQSTSASVTHERNSLLSLGVVAWSTRLSDELKNSEISVRKCRMLTEPISSRYPVYSYNYCLIECRIQIILRLCGCIPFFYKPLEHEKVCPLTELFCVVKHKKEIVSLSVSEKSREMHPNAKGLPRSSKDCGCLNVCDSVEYLKDKESLTPHSVITRLRVEITGFPKIRLVREVIFGFYDMLLRTGGVLNLCIGCSIISLAELAVIILKIPLGKICDYLKRRVLRLR